MGSCCAKEEEVADMQTTQTDLLIQIHKTLLQQELLLQAISAHTASTLPSVEALRSSLLCK